MSFDSGLFAQIPNEEVDAAIPTLCPHYHAAMTVLAEVAAWAEEGFPGASLEDVVRSIGTMELSPVGQECRRARPSF
jgi:hypothetical protein